MKSLKHLSIYFLLLVVTALVFTNCKRKRVREEATQPTSQEKMKNYEKQSPTNSFAQIDLHARKATRSSESSVAVLAAYLQQGTNGDIEKARAIYVWLTEKIRYDDRAFNTGSYGDLSPKGVLASRRAVCEGFTNLFEALALEMGLEVRKVVGYSKGYGYRPGKRISKTDHAWNLAKINGQWRIFDATWGQGNGKSVGGQLMTKKEFDDYWFDVDPYEAIFSHLPENAAFALVQPEMSLSTYQKFPYISKAYFELGFDGQETYKLALADPRVKFPETYNVDTYVKLEEAPGLKAIQQGKTYTFELYAPKASQVALIDAKKNWTFLEGDNGVFKLDYTPKNRGKLQLGLKHEGSGKSFSTALAYEVKGR